MPREPVRPAVFRIARVLAVLSAALSAPAPAPAQTLPATAPAIPTIPATNPAAVEAEIDGLLKQLASEDWPARTAAQDRLVALAELAEPRLQRAAREADDAEVRTRSEAALAQIAENRLIGPTLITLRVSNVSPRVAFDELARQAGVELKPQNPSLWNQQLPPVTLDVQREPLWEVVRQLREQCGLDLEAWNTGLSIMQTAPRGAKAPTAHHGPFRVRANRVSRSYAIDLASGGVLTNEFSVMLSFQAEPKLKVNSGSGLAKLEVAEDENGLSLLPGSGDGGGGGGPVRPRGFTDYVTRPGSASWPVTARLEYPQGAGKRIARLKGAASCSVVIRSETLEVPDILSVENLTREIGGAAVTIKGCRKVGDHFELTVTMSRDPSAPAAARVIRSGGQESIRLLDPAGREINRQGSSMSTNNGRIDMTIRYAAGPAPVAVNVPAKLVWQVPTEVREMQVPFEFTDLPLP